jgi:hypothetical protein
MGIAPVSAEIDINAICLFRTAVADRTSVEYRLARRQLALKDPNSSSWFVHISKKLQEYNLPSAHEVLENTPRKGQWNNKVRKAVIKHWEALHAEEIERKPMSTIRHMSKESLSLSKPALVWRASRDTLRETQKARVKAKLMTGALMLRASEARFSKNTSPVCRLCHTEAENREHFLLNCPTLAATRAKHMERLCAVLQEWNYTNIIQQKPILLQVLIDAQHHSIPADIRNNPDRLYLLEQISRDLIYYQYMDRTTRLNEVLQVK